MTSFFLLIVNHFNFNFLSFKKNRFFFSKINILMCFFFCSAYFPKWVPLYYRFNYFQYWIFMYFQPWLNEMFFLNRYQSLVSDEKILLFQFIWLIAKGLITHRQICLYILFSLINHWHSIWKKIPTIVNHFTMKNRYLSQHREREMHECLCQMIKSNMIYVTFHFLQIAIVLVKIFKLFWHTHTHTQYTQLHNSVV